MPLEEDISNFNLWAHKMGIPVDAIPNEEALKSAFKSRQSDVFFNLMKRIRPKHEVTQVKQNILVQRMEKMKDQIIPVARRGFLPKEMQRHLYIQDLKKQKEEIERKLNDTKNEYEALTASIKTKNIQKLQMQQKKDLLHSKVKILEIKSESLDESLRKEQSDKNKILSIMPVKIKSTNSSESIALNAMLNAIKELEEFYEFNLNDASSNNVQEHKNILWEKFRKIFSNVPNYLLWMNLLKAKDEQLQSLVELNKSCTVKGTPTSNENLTAFEIEILKARTRFFATLSKCVKEKEKIKQLNVRFLPVFRDFTESVKKKINLYKQEEDDSIDEFVSDYVVNYNSKIFKKAQLEYISKEIEQRKLQIIEGNRKMEDHQILLGSIREIYDEINASVQKIQQERSQLGQIKEKIIYSKTLLQYMLQNVQRTNVSFGAHKTKISSIGSDIFDGSDNILCSTKLDFENSVFNNTARSDITTIDAQNILPQYVNELLVLKDLSLEKLKYMGKECFFYLNPNPLLTDEIEFRPLLQLIPGYYLTPHGSLQDIKNKIKFDESIRKFCVDLKSEITPIKVDENRYKERKNTQIEQVTELIDGLDCIGIRTGNTLKSIQKYYNFILRNPLRNYVPPKKLFNNRTYADYESEYIMYYRMVTGSMSLK